MKFRPYLTFTFHHTVAAVVIAIAFHVIHLCYFSCSFHFHFSVLFVCIRAELQIMATPRIVCCSMCLPSVTSKTFRKMILLAAKFIFTKNIYIVGVECMRFIEDSF